jgi:hypothetical protein
MEHFEIVGEIVRGDIVLSDAQQAYMADCARQMPDGPFIAEFRRERKGITALQRGYWFAVVVPLVSEYTGDDRDSTHEDLKRLLFPRLGLPLSVTKRWKNKKTGRRRQRTREMSINDLNSKRMADLIDLVRKWAAEELPGGLHIPEPDKAWRQKREAA